jgi:hypothetical protein
MVHWTLNGYVLNYATVSTRLLMAMLSTMLHGFRLNTEGEILKGLLLISHQIVFYSVLSLLAKKDYYEAYHNIPLDFCLRMV